ncbi:hypothetical protein TNCV_535581 [Trichonephila clavipes]|nr:hypothetical protein TNCV_535581 [Trichonephila clavipes]
MLDHLEDNIRRVIADLRTQMLEKVIENWTSRLDYIRACRGSPMPEIIFKIGLEVSEKAIKVPKVRNALDVHGRKIVPLMLNEDQSSEEVKSASQAALKDMAKNGFQESFEDLYTPWHKCVVSQKSYFEVCVCERKLFSNEEVLNINTTLRSVATRRSYDTGQGLKKL